VYREEFLPDMNEIKQRAYFTAAASPERRLRAISESLETIAKNSGS